MQSTSERANLADDRNIGDLGRAAAERRRADWALPMNERLARLHSLCKQVGAIKGAQPAWGVFTFPNNANDGIFHIATGVIFAGVAAIQFRLDRGT